MSRPLPFATPHRAHNLPSASAPTTAGPEFHCAPFRAANLPHHTAPRAARVPEHPFEDCPRGSPPTVAMHHQRQSLDRKTRSSTTTHSETHVGVPRALMEEDPRLEQMLAAACPFSTQSRVTTTTTITTVVTTNTAAHPGDQARGLKPWFSTNTQTDVHESTTVAHNSELVAAGNPNAMHVEAALAAPAAPAADAENVHRRNGRRRSLDMTASPSSPHFPIRRSRRTSTPASVDNGTASKPTLSAKVTAIAEEGQTLQTPLVLLRLSRIPRPSDLVIVRLVANDHEAFEASGEFLAALDPKRASVASGELLISPITLPSYLSHVKLEECRLSFQWLSGERLLTSCVSEPLGTVSAGVASPPVLKRPKLE